jgi:hypothetical protein
LYLASGASDVDPLIGRFVESPRFGAGGAAAEAAGAGALSLIFYIFWKAACRVLILITELLTI